MTNANDKPVLGLATNFEVKAFLTEAGVSNDTDKFLIVTVDDEASLSKGIDARGSISFNMTGGLGYI